MYLIGEVDDAMSATVVAQLLWLEAADPDKPITLYVNSPGGSVSAGIVLNSAVLFPTHIAVLFVC